MKKSISNVVAGGLITGATVMGMDAIHNPASAAIMETKQAWDLNYVISETNTIDLACCTNSDTGSQDFVFGGFDESLGNLNTVTLDISLSGLTFDPAEVLGSSGGMQIVGQDSNTIDLDAANFSRNLNTISLDAAQFVGNLNTISLDFNMLFANNSVITSAETTGSVTLSYFYEPAAVPIPGSLALMAPALAALLASGAYRRRRREEDE